MSVLDLVVGSRVSLRGSARHVLKAFDELSENEANRCGWTSAEITALERLAAMEIAGIPFGDWPPA